MKRLNLIYILFVLLCFYSVPAQAERITIAISGHVLGVDDPYGHLENKIIAGTTTISGTYTYDSATLDSNPSPNIGEYWHYASPAGISVNSGGFVFQTNPNNVEFEIGVNKDTFADYYGVQSYHNSPLSNGALVDYISWQLDDPTGTALSNDALPLTEPDLTKWDGNQFTIEGVNDNNGYFLIGAEITGARVVPEPATILLLGLGMLLKRRIR